MVYICQILPLCRSEDIDWYRCWCKGYLYKVARSCLECLTKLCCLGWDISHDTVLDFIVFALNCTFRYLSEIRAIISFLFKWNSGSNLKILVCLRNEKQSLTPVNMLKFRSVAIFNKFGIAWNNIIAWLRIIWSNRRRLRRDAAIKVKCSSFIVLYVVK